MIDFGLKKLLVAHGLQKSDKKTNVKIKMSNNPRTVPYGTIIKKVLILFA
jgi:hypothetical protein